MSHEQADDVSEDGECSPECLLTSEPVKDPYSTDEKKAGCKKVREDSANQSDSKHKKRVKGRSRSREEVVEKTQPLMNVTIERITEAFNITFLALPELHKCKNFEQLKSFSINEVLDVLLPFITKDALSAKDVVDANFSLPDQSIVLRALYDIKGYNFPDTYSGDDSLLKRNVELYPKKEIDALVHSMEEIESIPTQVTEKTDNLSEQHHKIKDFFMDFFSFIREGLLYSGPCIKKLALPRTKASEHNARISDPVCDIVSSQPDLVIGKFYDYPVIPVEVYNPVKYADDDVPCLTPGGVSTRSAMSSKEEEDSISVKNFLSETIPNFFGAQSCWEHVKHKIAQHLLLQLLGTAKSHLDNKTKTTALSQRRAFIGLFIYNFYVYLFKLEGVEADIMRHIGNCEISKTGPLYVQFFPLPFDMRIASHGIALLLFLRYYRRIYCKH